MAKTNATYPDAYMGCNTLVRTHVQMKTQK